MKRLTVGLLFGNPSPERAVSVMTARNVAAGLDPRQYRVQPILLRADGRWTTGRGAGHLLGHRLRGVTKTEDPTRVAPRLDVAFLAVHGPGGEDGTLQGLLELLGIPYTGSGVLASALAMNKAASKVVLEAAGLPVAPGRLATTLDEARAVLRQIGLPAVVKPNASGSTIGVTLIRQTPQLARAYRLASRGRQQVLIERYVPGRELAAAVISSSHPRPLPVIEIVHHHPIFDYRAKYAGATVGATRELCPAPLRRTQTRRAQRLALTAHRVLGCRGVSRTDLMLDREGRLTILEINTLPGLTRASLVPKAAAAAGIGLSALLDRLITEALKR